MKKDFETKGGVNKGKILDEKEIKKSLKEIEEIKKKIVEIEGLVKQTIVETSGPYKEDKRKLLEIWNIKLKKLKEQLKEKE